MATQKWTYSKRNLLGKEKNCKAAKQFDEMMEIDHGKLENAIESKNSKKPKRKKTKVKVKTNTNKDEEDSSIHLFEYDLENTGKRKGKSTASKTANGHTKQMKVLKEIESSETENASTNTSLHVEIDDYHHNTVYKEKQITTEEDEEEEASIEESRKDNDCSKSQWNLLTKSELLPMVDSHQKSDLSLDACDLRDSPAVLTTLPPLTDIIFCPPTENIHGQQPEITGPKTATFRSGNKSIDSETNLMTSKMVSYSSGSSRSRSSNSKSSQYTKSSSSSSSQYTYSDVSVYTYGTAESSVTGEQITESTPRIKAKRRVVKNSTKIKGKESIDGIIFDGGAISPILKALSEKTPLKTTEVDKALLPSRKSCEVSTDMPQRGPRHCSTALFTPCQEEQGSMHLSPIISGITDGKNCETVVAALDHQLKSHCNEDFKKVEINANKISSSKEEIDSNSKRACSKRKPHSIDLANDRENPHTPKNKKGKTNVYMSSTKQRSSVSGICEITPRKEHDSFNKHDKVHHKETSTPIDKSRMNSILLSPILSENPDESGIDLYVKDSRDVITDEIIVPSFDSSACAEGVEELHNVEPLDLNTINVEQCNNVKKTIKDKSIKTNKVDVKKLKINEKLKNVVSLKFVQTSSHPNDPINIICRQRRKKKKVVNKQKSEKENIRSLTMKK